MSPGQKNLARRSGLAFAALCLLLFASTAHAQSLPGFQAPPKPTVKDDTAISIKVARGQAPLSKLYGHLKADASKAKLLRPLTEREKRQKSEKLLQIGVVRRLSSPLNPLTDGAAYTVPEGEVRVASVVTEGALYTRVHFKGMSLPAGARVFVYSIANPDEYYGPYEGLGLTDDGTFWTPPMQGDAVGIEYFTPAGTRADVPFKISEVSHIYKDAFATDAAGDCEQEVQTPWSFVKSSVGLLEFTTGGLEALCTGTLMNNAANDQKPYLLTANHCISTQTEAQSLRVFWDYNVGDFPSGFATDGANLLATGASSDFTFLFLTGTMPGGRFFSGWDASTFSGSATSNDIHHPNGSHKRQSVGNARQPTSASECDQSGTTGLQCVAVDWTSGVTEPGSSGSALWTGNPSDPGGPKLIGNLTGGPSACGTTDERDFFGRFSVTYPFIQQFLDNTACNTSLSPASQSFTNAGGGGSFSVTAACNWTAVSTASFVMITPPANGSGNGTVNFSVDANTGMQRSATIIVGSKAFVITQAAGGPCTPQSINVGETKNGTLAVGDCQLLDGTLADGYTFNGTAGQQISIFMTSSQFDTYLLLYNSNGRTLAQDDDGGGGTNSRIPASSGFFTLPTTGTYLIFANAFDLPNQGGVGDYSLTLTERPKQTITVASTPDSNVPITVTPSDLGGTSDGSTQFTRTYYQNTSVVLNAPGIAGGKEFKRWQKDGVDVPDNSNVVIVNMNADHTLTAVYGPITTYNLTIKSSNSGGGVIVGASPNDNNNASGGTTEFTLNYNRNTFVTLTAPANAPNGNIFQEWQRDGVHVSSDRSLLANADTNHTYTAVYVAPSTFTLTVNSTNPSSGVNITVSPNDLNNAGDGAAPFTRTYQQLTSITLTAPATAPNGNNFDRWTTTANGNTFDFNRTTTFNINSNLSLTAVYSTTPNVFTETSTNNAVAINSVTFLRGPFQILDSHNFSTDGHTRIILFTTDLGLPQGPNQPAYQLAVTVQGFGSPLDIEGVGPITGVPGLTGTYIVMRLPDGLPTGALQMTLLFHGVGGNTTTLNIAP
jgi:hypothetical protein